MENVGLMVALAGAMTKAPTAEQVSTAVDAWLDDHPEATTTVEDGSITNAKLATSFATPGVASAYSSSATYAVGDYVFYNGALYRCISAISTAEAWTAAHWTAAVLGDDVSDLKEDINDISDVITPINLIDPTTIVDNSLWQYQNPESGNYSRSGFVKVKPNTVYTFGNTEYMYWATTDVRARFVVYFDADKTRISTDSNATTFTTPNLCEYVVVTFRKNARNVVLLEGSYDATTQTMVYVPFADTAKKVDGQSIIDLTTDKIDNYAVPSKNLFDISKATLNAFLQVYPRVDTFSISFVSDYIPVKANVSYVISNDYIAGSHDYSCRSYVLYDNQFQKVSAENEDVKNKVLTPTVDGYLRFCGYSEQKDRTQVEVGTTPTPFEPYKMVFNNSAMLNDSQLDQMGNVLYGKKWVVCGDSFTNSGGTGTKLTQGRYIGRDYTYPWIIGNRQNMEIVKFFEGGRTLAFPAEPGTFVNSITNPTQDYYYQNIPADADYITIYLGINDEHHAPGSSGGDGEDNTGVIPIGTIDDATTATYLGAWNVVLTWLITNRPNAHIGIIVTNGIAGKDEYRQGQIAIAQKYGIPYIDMNGDSRTPAMLRTSNPNIPAAIKQALINKWAVDPATNTHPNDAAQLFESYFIENFLRSI